MPRRKYSVKEILKFTIPLIVSALSVNLMFAVDRIVLAYYSVDAMNAASIGGNFVTVVSFLAVNISQISVVFVGQYNGLKEYKKTGWAVWQMIYFGALSFLIFIPLAVVTDYISIFPEYYKYDGVRYQRLLMAFAGVPAIFGALSAFFIGRGQSLIVIAVTILGNIMNCLLDILFVFGIKEYIPSMGAEGAALATVVVEIIGTLILLSVFLNKNNRTVCNTLNYKFRKKIFLDCIKTGFPLAAGKSLSLFAWFAMLSLFSYASKDLATIESIIMSLWIIFVFFADGGGKAISSLSANLIGKNDLKAIQALLRTFFTFNWIMGAIFAIPLIFFQDIIFLFIGGANGTLAHLRQEFQFVFISVWVIILADGFFYLVCGILTSGGDTKFAAYLESITLWLFVVTPTAIMYYTGNLTTIRVAYVLIPLTTIANSVIAYYRYKKAIWFKRLV